MRYCIDFRSIGEKRKFGEKKYDKNSDKESDNHIYDKKMGDFIKFRSNSSEPSNLFIPLNRPGKRSGSRLAASPNLRRCTPNQFGTCYQYAAIYLFEKFLEDQAYAKDIILNAEVLNDVDKMYIVNYKQVYLKVSKYKKDEINSDNLKVVDVSHDNFEHEDNFMNIKATIKDISENEMEVSYWLDDKGQIKMIEHTIHNADGMLTGLIDALLRGGSTIEYLNVMALYFYEKNKIDYVEFYEDFYDENCELLGSWWSLKRNGIFHAISIIEEDKEEEGTSSEEGKKFFKVSDNSQIRGFNSLEKIEKEYLDMNWEIVSKKQIYYKEIFGDESDIENENVE